MKDREQAKAFFASMQPNAGSGKPASPFASQQMFNGRQRPDPSSVVRSDRYPIPAFAENRLRPNE